LGFNVNKMEANARRLLLGSRVYPPLRLGYQFLFDRARFVSRRAMRRFYSAFVRKGDLVAILFAAWKVVKKLKGSPWFPLVFVIFWYAFFLLGPATFGGMAAYQDFLLNAYFWLLLGLLFRLPTLALSAQYAANPRVTEPARRWIR
jgi:hypothetical protein